ncbi:MAG TPA: glycosyltransferase 87 family protein, partial [Gaiellaceae bacterium]|nr:glycosyltransferase 87 family protein [Gaiellaceae bacterium]
MSVRSESSSRSADAGAFLVALAAGLVLLAASWGLLHLGTFHRYQIIDTPVYQDYGEAMAAGQVPYRDFDLEYPPGALPVFWLPTLGPAEHYASIFEALMAICAVAMLVLVLRALVSLDASATRLLAVAVLVGLFPLALGSVVLSRYDLWPAALTVAALAAVLGGRDRLGLVVLGLAVTAKIYPLVLLPPILVYVVRRRGGREAMVGFGFFALVVAAVVLPFVIGSPGGLADSLQRQLERPLQIESLGASIL